MTDDSWPEDVFERLYKTNPDPWGFQTSAYERAKYGETLGALGSRRFRFVLELGCSIGVMTDALVPSCDRLLGIDIAETALELARARCAAHAQVAFRRCRLPDEFPALEPGSVDLILISELLYFLSPADNARLAADALRVLAPDGMVVLVNWTGDTNTPCTGDEAAQLFVQACMTAGLAVTLSSRPDSYRLDRLERGPAGREGAGSA
jgi:SAM-dependent methyltransferase